MLSGVTYFLHAILFGAGGISEQRADPPQVTLEEQIWFRNATNSHLWFAWIWHGLERFSFAVYYVWSGLGWFSSEPKG